MSSDLMSRHPRIAELFGIDLRTLALFRFTLGLVLFCLVCRASCDLGAFYTDAGVMPRGFVMESESVWRVSLYFLNGTSWFAAALLTLQAAFAAMFMLGWRTRLATVASFVLHLSLMNRDPLVLIGGDLLMNCLLFWACFLPLGTRFSVDAAISTNPPPAQNQHLSWASVALLLQVASVYFFTAILKAGAEWRVDHTAVYYALSLDRYATPLGQWLLNFPALLKFLTVYVWWLELLAALLIFTPLLQKPARFVAMVLLMLMHVGFMLCLEIGHFPFVSLASLTLLCGGWVWDALARRDAARHPGTLAIYYDRDCAFCLKMCRLFQQFLLLPRVQILPAQDTPRARTLLEANNSWVVIDTDQQAHLKWPAFAVLLKHSPLLGWTQRLSGSSKLVAPGNRAYDFVARHRARFAAASAFLMPQSEIRWEISLRWQRFAAMFAVLVLAWNLTAVGVLPLYSYKLLEPVLRTLRIDQYWNMFAPFPLKEDGWVVVPGRLADGREIDLLHPDRGEPDYRKPENYAGSHESVRWHTLRARMWEDEYARHRPYYGSYLCRQWNHDRTDPQQLLLSLKIIYMLERTPPPGQTASIEQQIVWRQDCFTEQPQGKTP